MVTRQASVWSSIATTRWVPPVAVALVAATFARHGLHADAAAWAVVQVVLVALAAYDLATRRLPNAVTVPVSLLAVAFRAAFERSELGKVALAGGITFVVFLALAVAFRGGFGMGDVKLGAMLGFLLGGAVVPALTVGILAAGLVAVALLATSRVGLRSAIAYGPYLAFGGAVAILFSHPPALV